MKEQVKTHNAIAMFILSVIVLTSFGSVVHAEAGENFLSTKDSNFFVGSDKSILAFQLDKSVDSGNSYLRTLPGYKSPTTAFMLSLIFPGGGQYYNGDIGKGVALDTWAVAGLVLVVLGSDENHKIYSDSNSEFKTFGIVMIVTGSLWGIIDAPLSAEKKNKRLGVNEFSRLIEFGSQNHFVGVDLVGFEERIEARLTYHF